MKIKHLKGNITRVQHVKMKRLKQYIIQQKINYHYNMRNVLLYSRSYSKGLVKDEDDELWHRAACELRCAQRMEKILKRYL
jgi:hypothetical protein